MLPKISDKASHNKLIREFNISCDAPTSILDHWEVFSSIVKHPDFGSKWRVELLFFSKKWFNDLSDNVWVKFRNYLLNRVWLHSEFKRNRIVWDFIFSMVKENKNIKSDPYLTNIVEHLLYVAAGEFPGFSPAIDDRSGPIARLQEIYLNVYGLKDYAPIIMEPNFFSINNESRPVYYSLQHPTAMEFSQKSNKRASAIDYLYLTNLTLSKYISELLYGGYNLEDAILYKIIKKTNFSCFHSNIDKPITGIHDSQEIPREDMFFLDRLPSCRGKRFPISNTFLKGCVRLSKKKEV